MKPIFKNTEDWQKAEILMQPALIRVLDNLRKQLEQSEWTATYQEVETPYPGHQLSLTYQEKIVIINIWELCFQVCFLNYQLSFNHGDNACQHEQSVEIDSSLIDNTGELNWQQLDIKSKEVIQEMLISLSSH
ncbi:conserved hypothetical protein [Rippkaea orientalis PCC 8801]|uniref:Uncharacterized protein n=1 Tax=Rippkaea orientalis (strain PCC 8801 / RF-1) TaxID=41431 RepID=B7K0L5_RIPO1|nr:hypothetical protein [Rippkaea orientalis]ACK64169.1 conserved hypothetical protein [Rippkaea orientalis PCC 8801]